MIAATGEFDPKLYDFIETGMVQEVTENFQDIIEDKIFKYKYRQNADAPDVFADRNARMKTRFLERAKTRDPTIEQDIEKLYLDDSKYASLAAAMVDRENFSDVAREQTLAYREYMAREGVQ